jgi:hypothetical protein
MYTTQVGKGKGEREEGGMKHSYKCRKQTFSYGLLCTQPWRAPPHPLHPPEPARDLPCSSIHTTIPCRSLRTRPPAHAANPGIPAEHPGCCWHPAPSSPPPIYTFLKTVGHYPFQTPPLYEGKGCSARSGKGGGRGTRADTSLFPVRADHIKAVVYLR